MGRKHMSKNVGTHITHCCHLHGCKYYLPDDEYCPVEAGELAQEYPCEYCHTEEELEETILSAAQELKFIRSLKKETI